MEIIFKNDYYNSSLFYILNWEKNRYINNYPKNDS